MFWESRGYDIAAAVREWVRAYGEDHPDQEWLLSDYDSWHENPFYRGVKGPHPEDDGSYYFFKDGTPVTDDAYAGLPRRGRG
jgi:hypothetical protein